MVQINLTELYTVKEVTEFLKCGKSTVYNLVGSGALAVTKIGAFGGGIRVDMKAPHW